MGARGEAGVSDAPAPQLLQRLSRRRLRVPGAGTVGGFGEHASKSLGPGLEFAEHRDYQPGDDLRRLDPQLLARTGQAYIRQYDMTEPLAVTVLLDASASMGVGGPPPVKMARALAGALAYVGLAGADRVQLVAFGGPRLRYAPRMVGTRGAIRLFDWLAKQEPAGAAELGAVARSLAPRLPRPGLTLLISDWLFTGAEEGVSALRAAKQVVVGFKVAAPEELDPTLLGVGSVTLEDSESGAEIEVQLDRVTLQRYAAELARREAELSSLLVRHGGAWLQVRPHEELDRVLLERCAQAGLVL
jgi:uncharacterized protein (DUF58 family)